ncbi:Apolipoprotein N-acyltransferase [Gloeocapsa sp. PCC 7428]|nr:Apolipoprotein N-acyltransferase [Gloeocapsa sp. PCC 7428]
MPIVKTKLSKQHQRWTLPAFGFLALSSGILMGLTVAPVEAWFLAWIALVPLWVIVASSTPQKTKLLSALLWGIGYHGVALAWITGVHPMMWMGVPWLASIAIALFCWVAITLWGAVLVTAWAVCMTIFSRGVGTFTRVLIGVALWCGLESLWSLGPLYWTSLSYTQSPHNLIILHLGQISGSLTVTAAIVAVNGLLAEAWMRYERSEVGGRRSGKNTITLRLFASSCLLFVALHLVGFGLYSRPLVQPPETALRVGIIQGNIPNTIKLYSEGLRRAIAGYTEGYITLAEQGVEAVLTPEGALPFMWSEVLRTSLYTAVQEKGVTAWIGAFGEQGQNYTNSLFTLTGDGTVLSRYDKVKLVPIGEYIPFEQVLGGLVRRLSPLEAKLVPGAPDQVFDTPFGRAIAVICYSSAFPEQVRYQAAAGGQFILSAANNAHYSPSMPAQHHAQDTMRAIETDRWAVRATNTGYSGIVDPHGRTVWISNLNTYELHAETIYRRTTQTLYVRWGDWLTPLLLGLAVISKLIFLQASQK